MHPPKPKPCYVDWNEPLQAQAFQVNAHKTEYMWFNQTGDISTLNGSSLKLVDKFTYLGSSVSSTEKDIDMQLEKAWTAFDRLSVIWKSDLTDKIKRSLFQAAVVSILLYGCTTWTLTKHMEEKLGGNYTRIILLIIMSCRQHGYPWPSIATSPYRSSRPAGLQGYILYPHIAAVCMLELVVLLLLCHMWGSIGVHH